MNCPDCHRPLIQIGGLAIHCNKWGKPGDKNLMMELSEGDLEALKQIRKN